jgi:D-alanine-D-alanine ligase
VKKAGLNVPRSVLVMKADDQGEKVCEIINSFAPPYIVKPSDLGSSVGLFLVRSTNELGNILQEAYKFSNTVLVEEYIKGREATCGVVENYRERDLYALLPVEIRPPAGKNLFDYDAKYSGQSEEICPGNFSPSEKAELERLAVLAHQALGLRHYSRSDFIVTPRGIYFLEVNTLPGLTTASLLPKSLAAVGFQYPDFLDHLINLALAK